MALKIGDRVRENTSSTGVGGLSLTGAPAGFQRFSAVLASGDVTYYSLEENDKFEVGIGTYGSNNLERTTVLSSSNSGGKISLGGSGVVFITYPADKALFTDVNDQFVLGASGLLFANGTTFKDAKLVELTDVNVSGTPTQDTVFNLNITNKSLSLGDMTGATNTNNVLIGFGAASGITNAQHNVVIGSESSGMNKTGSRNVYVGSNSGPSDASASTSTYESVAVGCDAGNLIRQQSTVMGYTAGASSYEIGFTAIGYQAGTNVGSYSTTIGYQAGSSLSEDYSVCLGYRAGYNGAGASSVWIGRGAGTSASSSTNSIGIGLDAGKSSSATESIYIGESAGESNSIDNLIFIGNASPSSNGTLIKGDMSNKRVAIGVADVTLDDTLFVGINSATDEGVVVKGHAAQSANLTSWKNNVDGIMAAVSPNGVVSANIIHATGNGILIDSSTPASTANKLYNIGSDLYWNGSALSSQVSAADLNYVSGVAAYASGHVYNDTYVSGIAVYSSGQAVVNQSNITALLAASGTATSLISSSGVATYASGQAVSNQSTISINTSRVAYASGQAISNQSEIIAVSGWSDSTFLKIDDDTYVSGIAAYGSGQAVSNQSSISTNSSNISTNTNNISTNSSRVAYASGLAISNELNVAYASGQAIANEGDIFAVSGIAAYASGVGGGDVTTAQLNYVSGIAVYASGHVHDDLYVSGIANYASGQATSNQGNITALLSASGTATSLIASSGIANYASGQAVSNQASITTNANNITYVSGVATNKFTVTAADSSNYTIDGMGLNSATDPSIYLHKGHTYYFDKQTSGHPFRVSTSNGGSAYQDADGNNIEISGQGVLKFEVPQDAPDKLYYYCTSHAAMNGVIYTTNNVDEIIHVSGIAAYASGQAITNQGNITALNTASGIATSLLAVSGTATSLVATSGVAAYASGQAIANETDIAYVSGVAAYASGEVNTYTAGSGLTLVGNEFNIHSGTGNFAKLEIKPTTTTNAGLIVQSAVSQSANLQEWQNSSENTLSQIDTSGVYRNIIGSNGTDVLRLQYGDPLHDHDGSTGVEVKAVWLDYEDGSEYADPINNNSLVIGTWYNTAKTIPSRIKISATAFNLSLANSSKINCESSTTKFNTNVQPWSSASTLDLGQPTSAWANIYAKGTVYTSGIYASGVELANHVPADTTNALYNEGGTLKFNGSAVGGGGGDVTTAQLNYVSGIAVYSSGQAISNQSNITALSTASGIATSLLAVSGTATSLVATSGIATYASGNTANISFGSNAEGDLLYHNGTSFIRLPKGTDDYILKMNGNVPNWEADSGGSSLSAGSGVFVDGASKINVYGGSGNFQELQVTSDNVFVPKVVFTGSGAVDTPITLETRSSYESVSGSGSALLFQGTQGQLFSITDNLSSGVIFSVADIAGLPLIEADASGDVKLAEFGRYVGVGSGIPEYGIDISASGRIQKGVVLSSYVPAVTTNTLYNEGGTLKFNGSSIGGGGVDTYTSGVATYASGQAISNQSSITALLSASGTATSLIASSGIASYASGQAISNQGNITALLSASGTATSLIASSGAATYASGNTANISFGSNAEGDILIHDGSKFTRLAKGTDNYILKMNGNLPNWEAESGGGGSSLTAGSGITIDGADKINVHGGSGHFINLNVEGAFSATTKSFLIDHPTKEGMKLQYASLEGPENGVYVRGTSGSNIITLPDYWSTLVDQSTVTVSLTPVGYYQALYVEEKGKNYIKVGGAKGSYDYVIYGERKDVEKLKVEW